MKQLSFKHPYCVLIFSRRCWHEGHLKSSAAARLKFIAFTPFIAAVVGNVECLQLSVSHLFRSVGQSAGLAVQQTAKRLRYFTRSHVPKRSTLRVYVKVTDPSAVVLSGSECTLLVMEAYTNDSRAVVRVGGKCPVDGRNSRHSQSLIE